MHERRIKAPTRATPALGSRADRCNINTMRAVLALLLTLSAACPGMAFAEPHGAVLSDADQAALKQVETYLDGLTALKARFTQTAETGSTATGTAWLVRPGRMRFEYDPPSPLLLVAGHDLVVFRDNKLDQTTNIPIGQTPLGLLLKDHLTLSGAVTVTSFERLSDTWRVTLEKTESPGDGTLTLVLHASPLALTGWSVVDAEGHETRVSLSGITLGGEYPAKLFTFIDPHFFDGNGNTP